MRLLTGRTTRGNVRLDMTTHTCLVLGLMSGCFAVGAAAQAPALSPDTRAFVKVDAPIVALVHARVIDGTGVPSRPDQVVVLERGLIRAVGDSVQVSIPPGAQVLDVAGRTVLPGFVMVHEHMFYPGVLWADGYLANEQGF